MKKTRTGGQAVLEGVMMRSTKNTAIAVRRENGEIAAEVKPTKSFSQKHAFFRAPIVRGVVNFVESLVLGIKTITDALKIYDPQMAEEEEKPNKAEEFIAKKTGKDPLDVAIFFAVLIAVVLAVGLFFILPNLVTGWLTPYVTQPIIKNLIDGGIRIAVFIVYLVIITNMKEIKRLFAYHGAEHKTINCYESEKPLDVAHVRECSRLHPRCGTSFLFLVIIISILLFSLFGWSENPLIRIGLRLAMLPVVAGVSYEFLRFLGWSDSAFARAVRKPGMALQRLTTREPDDSMIEVAIVSFKMAEGETAAEDIEALRQSYYREPEEPKEEKETNEGAAEETG